MSQFEDDKVNEYLKNSESYKIADRNIKPKDSKDLMVRAFQVNKESLLIIKKKPNDILKLKDGKQINLEIDTFITSNGKSFSPEKFASIYKPAGQLVKNFLQLRQDSLLNTPDILEKIHGKNVDKPKPKAGNSI
jgi:hypothetical protein